jgi:protein-tyrosine-phosphatase
MNFPYKNILIVCSVNTARSPMVVGFLKEILKDNKEIKICSGGISSNARDGMLISLDAILAMKEAGIDLPEESLSIDLKKHSYLIEDADLILTLTERHITELHQFIGKNSKKILTLKQFAGECGDIDDPSMKGLEGFRRARDEIYEALSKGMKKLGHSS